MAQRDTLSIVPSNSSVDRGQRGRTGDSDRPNPELGHRLVRAFLNIRHPGLREAVVNFVSELSTLRDDEP